MDNLQHYWNASSATIPGDKDPSAYAIQKEPLFPRQAVVCDLGGGSGVDSLYFASRGHYVKLVDISDHALGQANAAAAKQGLGQQIETIQCNLDNGVVPLPAAACDVVYSRLTLHYFDSATLTRLFKEIYRLLKPGAKAFLTLKSPEDAAEMDYLRSTATQKEAGVFEEAGHIKTRFTLGQLNDLLHAAGIQAPEFTAANYSEDLGGRKDKIKSGNTKMLLNEIQITKAAAA
jgi:SAM-dependent methyltransferase